MRGEHDVQAADHRQRLPALQTEEHGGDLDGGEVHRGHDDAVEQEAQVEGAKAAHDTGRGVRVADLVELQIRHHPRTSPELCVEEHGRHPGQHERPPDPVAGDARAADDVGDQVGGVAAEGRGDHREAAQPPGHRSTRGEELGGAPSRPPAEEERRDEADEERREDNDPVEELQPHLSRSIHLD